MRPRKTIPENGFSQVLPMLWNEKYAPKSLAEFAGNPSAVAQVKAWALDWARGKPGKPLLLHGPPGTGKGALVRALAGEMGWEIVEANASESRNKGDVERVIGSAASSRSLSGAQKLVFIDDVDAISGNEDRGGMGAVAEVLRSARNPVIATAGDYWDQRLRNLRTLWERVDFRRVHPSTIASALDRILEKEGILAPREATEKIAEGSNGDLRSAINDLQAIAEGRKAVTPKEVEGMRSAFSRDRGREVRDAVSAIMHATGYGEAQKIMWSIEEDPEFVKRWIEDVIPLEYTEKGDVARAFGALSRSDVFSGRIRSRQYWGFLRYATALMGAGVALSKRREYRHYAKYGVVPSYLMRLSRSKGARAKMKEVSLKIGARCHASSREAASVYVPLVRLLLEEREGARETARYFNFDAEEVAFLTGKSEAQAKKLVEGAGEGKADKGRKPAAKRKAKRETGAPKP